MSLSWDLSLNSEVVDCFGVGNGWMIAEAEVSGSLQRGVNERLSE